MKKALIIGLNNYSSCPLNWCSNDANELSELIETNTDGSHNFDVFKIIGNIDKNQMYSAIKTLFDGDTDTALLYFSGHGSCENGGYLCSTDILAGDRELGVRMEDILNIANSSRCKNKVIILDCCFAAKLGELSAFGECSHLSNGLTIIAACREYQYSAENKEIQHGVFTNLLLEGLRGGAADIAGNITPARLYSFIDQSLGAWEQRPVFKTNTSRFISLRTVSPKVPKYIIRNLTTYFDNSTDRFKLDPSYEFTNSPEYEPICKKPYANEEHVKIFKELQLLVSAGLVEPEGAQHMYFAAIKEKSCKLTKLGQHYWRLVRDKRL